jgi:hypothetical protein
VVPRDQVVPQIDPRETVLYKSVKMVIPLLLLLSTVVSGQLTLWYTYVCPYDNATAVTTSTCESTPATVELWDVTDNSTVVTQLTLTPSPYTLGVPITLPVTTGVVQYQLYLANDHTDARCTVDVSLEDSQAAVYLLQPLYFTCSHNYSFSLNGTAFEAVPTEWQTASSSLTAVNAFPAIRLEGGMPTSVCSFANVTWSIVSTTTGSILISGSANLAPGIGTMHTGAVSGQVANDSYLFSLNAENCPNAGNELTFVLSLAPASNVTGTLIYDDLNIFWYSQLNVSFTVSGDEIMDVSHAVDYAPTPSPTTASPTTASPTASPTNTGSPTMAPTTAAPTTMAPTSAPTNAANITLTVLGFFIEAKNTSQFVCSPNVTVLIWDTMAGAAVLMSDTVDGIMGYNASAMISYQQNLQVNISNGNVDPHCAMDFYFQADGAIIQDTFLPNTTRSVNISLDSPGALTGGEPASSVRYPALRLVLGPVDPACDQTVQWNLMAGGLESYRNIAFTHWTSTSMGILDGYFQFQIQNQIVAGALGAGEPGCNPVFSLSFHKTSPIDANPVSPVMLFDSYASTNKQWTLNCSVVFYVRNGSYVQGTDQVYIDAPIPNIIVTTDAPMKRTISGWVIGIIVILSWVVIVLGCVYCRKCFHVRYNDKTGKVELGQQGLRWSNEYQSMH